MPQPAAKLTGFLVRNRAGILSFTMAVGLFFGVFLVAEAVCYVRFLAKDALSLRDTDLRTRLIVKPSPYGYTLRPNSTCRDRLAYRGAVEYDVTYYTDELGRRRAVADDAAKRDRFAVWFTDSFAFGMGVEENHTLSHGFSERATRYAPYNYGVPSYGPQQMLLKLESGALPGEIREKEGVALYVFIHRHFSRLLGTMGTYTAAQIFPCYELEEDKVRYRGSFSQAHPWRTKLYALLGKSNVLACANVDLPLSGPDKAVELMARVLEKSRAEFRKQFGGSEFYVLIYPCPYTEFDNQTVTRLCGRLKELQVPFFDYRGVLDDLPGKIFFHDTHPLPQCNARVTQLLADDLKDR